MGVCSPAVFPQKGYSVREMGFDGAWEALKGYVKTIMMPKECTDCPRKDRCSICAASCIAETGDSSVCPKYICRMTKAYDELLHEKYGAKKNEENNNEN